MIGSDPAAVREDSYGELALTTQTVNAIVVGICLFLAAAAVVFYEIFSVFPW